MDIRTIVRSTVLHGTMVALFLGSISGCSSGPGVGCFYVEVSPAKFLAVKFDGEIGYGSNLKIRHGNQTVLFKLPRGQRVSANQYC
jgi:hypothetical protein